MRALLTRFQTQPSVLYRKDRYFYLKYDIPYLVLFVAASAALWFAGWRGFVTSFEPWILLLVVPAMYLHVLANVCVHNACHVNFPRRINRLVGEILGVIVVVRFANWEVLHVRHHRYADDVEKDPHPANDHFWRFLVDMMLVNLERQLMNTFYDQFGDTPENRLFEKRRAMLSFTTEAMCVLFWFVLLGWPLFLVVFVPAQIVGWIVVSHFNWATHNGGSPDRNYRPINIDTGLYWIGNRIWFGLYMHENHHKRANIFNPLRMEQVLARRAARRAAMAAAGGAVVEDEA